MPEYSLKQKRIVYYSTYVFKMYGNVKVSRKPPKDAILSNYLRVIYNV